MPKSRRGSFQLRIPACWSGWTEAGQDVSFAEMARRQVAAVKVIAADPAVAAVSSSIAAGLGGQTGNNGRIWTNLKPFEDRDVTAQQVIARLRPQLAGIEGMNVYFQAAQDINIGGRLAKTQYQYTMQDADLAELYDWSPKVLAKLRSLPMLRDLATDQQVAGTTATLTIDRDRAARFGIQPQLIDDTLYDAFGQRQVAQYSTQLNSYKIILEVPPDIQGNVATLDKLYVRVRDGVAVPLSTFVTIDTKPVAPLAISHQSQFPAVTISFNLAAGAALGQAVDAISAAMAELGAPVTLRGTFQGTAQAFQASLSTQPYLIAAALIAVYIILGILYESFILPITILSTLPSAGVGALLMLMVAGYDLSVIALNRGDPADRHRQEERDHDGGLRHQRRTPARRPAARGHPRGLLDALPADPDDDDGGVAGRVAAHARQRRRIGAAPSARICDGRWPDFQPGPDALHHSGRLSLFGSLAALALPSASRHHARLGQQDRRDR